MTRDNRRRFV